MRNLNDWVGYLPRSEVKVSQVERPTEQSQRLLILRVGDKLADSRN